MKKLLTAITCALLITAPSLAACSNSDNTNASTSLTADAFADRIKDDNVTILDVRTPAEYADGHIPGAINLDVQNASEFNAGLQQLDNNTTYAVYCRSGKRSKVAMDELQQAGFTTFDLDGGIKAWNGPTEK